METEKFEITNINWNYRDSNNIGQTSVQKIKTDLDSINVRCKSCATSWRATSGHASGNFQHNIGSLNITCPQCSVKESLSDQIVKNL